MKLSKKLLMASLIVSGAAATLLSIQPSFAAGGKLEITTYTNKWGAKVGQETDRSGCGGPTTFWGVKTNYFTVKAINCPS